MKRSEINIHHEGQKNNIKNPVYVVQFKKRAPHQEDNGHQRQVNYSTILSSSQGQLICVLKNYFTTNIPYSNTGKHKAKNPEKYEIKKYKTFFIENYN